MPAFNDRVFRPGEIGVVSRSGSLGTLIALNLVQGGLGISAFIGIGGDPIIGTTTRDAVEALDKDARTKGLVLVGEVGGAVGGRSDDGRGGEEGVSTGGFRWGPNIR